jgi:hypothetical protein
MPDPQNLAMHFSKFTSQPAYIAKVIQIKA